MKPSWNPATSQTAWWKTVILITRPLPFRHQPQAALCGSGPTTEEPTGAGSEKEELQCNSAAGLDLARRAALGHGAAESQGTATGSLGRCGTGAQSARLGSAFSLVLLRSGL